MAIEEEPGPELLGHHHLLDWLEDSISFLPSFLNEPYCAPDAAGRWYWDHGQTQLDHQARPFDAAATTTPTGTVSSTASVSVPSVAEPEAPKKRKQPDGGPAVDKANHSLRRKTSSGCGDEGDGGNEEDAEVRRNHPAAAAAAARGKSSKKSQCRSGGGNQGNAGSKDVRWAEQLLNPCAMAAHPAPLRVGDGRNPSRVGDEHLRHERQRGRSLHVRDDGAEAIPVRPDQIPGDQPVVRLPQFRRQRLHRPGGITGISCPGVEVPCGCWFPRPQQTPAKSSGSGDDLVDVYASTGSRWGFDLRGSAGGGLTISSTPSAASSLGFRPNFANGESSRAGG